MAALLNSLESVAWQKIHHPGGGTHPVPTVLTRAPCSASMAFCEEGKEDRQMQALLSVGGPQLPDQLQLALLAVAVDVPFQEELITLL